jgi:hypothetical protein
MNGSNVFEIEQRLGASQRRSNSQDMGPLLGSALYLFQRLSADGV